MNHTTTSEPHNDALIDWFHGTSAGDKYAPGSEDRAIYDRAMERLRRMYRL